MPEADSVHSTPPLDASATPNFSSLAVAVSPAWHQAIIRLAAATEKMAKRFDAWGTATSEGGRLQAECRALAETLIDFLDEWDGDSDLEQQVDDEPCDDTELEPSLCGVTVGAGDEHDRENDDDREPSLGWTVDGFRGAANDCEGNS